MKAKITKATLKYEKTYRSAYAIYSKKLETNRTRNEKAKKNAYVEFRKKVDAASSKLEIANKAQMEIK